MTSATKRVVFFGTYREEYARNQISIEGLRRAGWQVVECHAPLWHGIEDRVQAASGGWMSLGFLWRVVNAYLQLLSRYRKSGQYDVLLVGYPGHFDVFLGFLLASLRHKPLAWDVFNSLYLITIERGIQKRSGFTVEMIRRIEHLACRLPDMLFLDSQQFVDWFVETHHLDSQRFRLVRIGADERNFQPLEKVRPGDDSFRIIYYGSYIPNHGVEYIIEAARILDAETSLEPVTIEMIGNGPERSKAMALAEKYQLKNVSFIDWLEPGVLAEHIAECDVVLGAFGTTQQLLLTNNNKIYEGFAMHKAVISARTPSMPDKLHHGEHLYLCERGNPTDLAAAVRILQDNPTLRDQLAENGYQIFNEYFNVTAIGRQAAGHLEELIKG